MLGHAVRHCCWLDAVGLAVQFLRGLPRHELVGRHGPAKGGVQGAHPGTAPAGQLSTSLGPSRVRPAQPNCLPLPPPRPIAATWSGAGLEGLMTQARTAGMPGRVTSQSGSASWPADTDRRREQIAELLLQTAEFISPARVEETARGWLLRAARACCMDHAVVLQNTFKQFQRHVVGAGEMSMIRPRN